MARRNNIWEQIWESTEGPTVTVTIPRDHAESLLKMLAGALEQDIDDGGMGDEEEDLDSVADLDFDGPGGPPDDMDMDFDMGGDDELPAGDEDDEGGDEGPPTKRGPGRPPGAKNKKKSDGPEKKKDDDDDEDTKEESSDISDVRPQTALGESAFSRLNRSLSAPRRRR